MAKCQYTDCENWTPEMEEDECEDCCEGRWMPAVNDHASTCDGCAELTSHNEMTMVEKTQLGYCESCAKEMGISKCADCQESTVNESIIMDEETKLWYCDECAKKRGLTVAFTRDT